MSDKPDSRLKKRRRRALLDADVESLGDAPPAVEFDSEELVSPESPSPDSFDPCLTVESLCSTASVSHSAAESSAESSDRPCIPAGGSQVIMNPPLSSTSSTDPDSIITELADPQHSLADAFVAETTLNSSQCVSGTLSILSSQSQATNVTGDMSVSFEVQGNPSFTPESLSTITSIATGQKMDWHSFLPLRQDFELPSPTSDVPDSTTAEEDFCCDESDNWQGVDPKVPDTLPLYEGSPLLLKECLISILAFVQATHLSGRDMSKLLELMNLLLPQPNNLPKSSHMFYKLLEFQESELLMFYFCNKCWQKRNSLHDICPNCKDPKRKVNYFITCPIIPQLRKLYSRQGFSDLIQYRFNRKKQCDENIEDIYDGSVYKSAELTVLRDWKNISLQWYTDGISLYECSAYSLWPFMFVINELPPSERYKPENVILGGMWGCEEKPHPNVFLLPIYQEISELVKGFTVRFYGSEEEVEVLACLLCGTCDVPAKACCMHMKGHAGYDSCPKCFIHGEKSQRTGNVMVFPHQDQLELRNNTNYWQCVQESVKHDDGYLGVKGPSILYFMTLPDFISSVAIDSMHCIYIGIGKQLLNLWFNTTFTAESFSVTQKIPLVNERLLALQLPHFVERSTLGVDKLAFWKASLCMNFLLYIALPVMNGILSDDLFEHLKLLVTGISLLNGSSISQSDIRKANELLCQFCKDFQVLYGVRYMSSNLHLLRHLPQAVSETGNLWVTSCFRFEDLNGKLANLAHGTSHSSLQICSRFSLLSELQIMISKLSSMSLRLYSEKLTVHKRYLNICERISSKLYVIGKFTENCTLNDRIAELLVEKFHAPVPFQTFSRLYKHKQLYVSSSYVRGMRNSSYCKFQNGLSESHGNILTFVKTSFTESCYFAVIVQNVFEIPYMPRYHRVDDATHDLTLVDVSNLISVSFCLNVKDYKYVVDPLNLLEMM